MNDVPLHIVKQNKYFMAKVNIEQLGKEEIEERRIKSWPLWEREVSRFDWTYDADEECYILEGEVEVQTSEGNYQMRPGDFVTFNRGLNCVWDIKKSIRKNYRFT
jgi:uncharacterized protein